MRLVLAFFIASSLSFVCTESIFAQQEKDETYLARVISMEESKEKAVPNIDKQVMYKTVTVLFLNGELEGQSKELTDAGFLLTVGSKVYVRHVTAFDGSQYFSIQEPYRLPVLGFIVFGFIVLVFILGGKQGILSMIALFVSFGLIFRYLFPSILTGGNVIVLSTIGALLTLLVVMVMTHGFTRLTLSAYLGCLLSVFATLFFATWAVKATALTGFASEESVYLNLATNGNINFVALLIGGIIIGVVGVLDDITITQASVVNELYRANTSLTKLELYKRALRVGKDHMGAVINTLILAYTGASLPIVLLLYVSDSPFLELVNREVITTEIIRSIAGSAGLLVAVPLTTLIAVFLVKGDETTHKHHHHA